MSSKCCLLYSIILINNYNSHEGNKTVIHVDYNQLDDPFPISRLHFMFYICQTCRMNAIFWSNKVYPGIWRSSLNGSGVLPVLINNSHIGKYFKLLKHAH